VADSQVEGARAIAAEPPDLIMINLLMFMKIYQIATGYF
jgi:hypothetical protein